MHDLQHRFALAALFVAGLASLFALNGIPASGAPDLQHRDVMLAAIAAALSLSPWVAALRMPAIAVALLAKVTFIGVALAGGTSTAWASEAFQVVLLVGAGAILLRDARREAAWDGVVPLREEW